MRLARQLAGEWRLWFEALRALAGNPVAHYLRVQMHRSRGRIPAVRRYLLLILICAISVILLGYFFLRLFAAGISPGETAIYTWWFLLTALTAVLIIVALRLISTTVTDLLRALAATGGKSRTRLVDEALAASAIGDREIVIGILSVIVPRFAWISIVGGVLYWLWWSTLPLIDDGWRSSEFARALYTAPLTVGGIALSGILGALVLALWLLCLGRGSSGLYSAAAAGLIISAGHLLYIPLVLGLTVYTQLGGHSGSYAQLSLAWPLYRLLVMVLFIAGYELLLSDAVRHRRASAFYAVFSPLILPLVLAGILAYVSLAHYYEPNLRVLPLFISQVWGATTLFNPLAVPSRVCLWHEIGSYVDWLDVNYLLLILQQLLMIAIGAYKARLAVARWRQRPV